jgi:23S rRNA pseudouridine2605 synthase
MPEPIRLNKYLAETQGYSRRQADELITTGKILVNSIQPVLGARLTPGVDTLTVNGSVIDTKQATTFSYVMLNKPIDYVCSRKRQGDNPTIYELLPEQYHALKPVGRLDKDSSGLLLLTNDGDFAFQMTHPKFYKTKVYTVKLDRPLEPLHQQMISDHGVQLPDGPSKFSITKEGERNYEITMHEGRNRQIRRTFLALGYTVVKLHRTVFGAYTLTDLVNGHFKKITK